MSIKQAATYTVFCCMIIFGLQNCAGTGGLGESSGNERTYDTDYSTIKNLVREVVRNSTLAVISEDESPEKEETIFRISKSRYVGEQQVNQHEGAVIVRRLDGRKTSVEVENPEYHFTVPDYKKENYRRQIFAQLEKKLKR